jgi:hypothetical protein
MKKVFNTSDQVIHLFAQRTQSEARCSNVYFDNMNEIYSYGRHYLLGQFVTNKNDELAIIINDTGYSVTTAKHIRELSYATNQYKRFFTMSIEPAKVMYQLEQFVSKLQNARKPELYINPAEILYTKFHEYQTWNGKSNDVANLEKIEALINTFRGGSYPEYLAQRAEAIKQDKIRREKIEKEQNEKQLKEFFDYKRDYLYNRIDEDYLRISQDGEFIETTQNVKVPIKEAKILYMLIKSGKDIKGYNISGYTVIGLNGELKIGCHKINLKNMNEIGEKIIN